MRLTAFRGRGVAARATRPIVRASREGGISRGRSRCRYGNRPNREKRTAAVSEIGAGYRSLGQHLIDEACETDANDTGLDIDEGFETSGRRVLLKTFAKVFRTHVWQFASIAVALALVTTVILAQPLLSGSFFQCLMGPVNTQKLKMVLLALGITYVTEPLCTFIYVVSISKIIQAFISRLQRQLFARILLQNTGFYDLNSTTELMSVLSTELNTVSDILNGNVSRDRGLRAVCEATGDIIILTVIAPQLAPVLILFIVFTSVNAALFSRRTKGAFVERELFKVKLGGTASSAFTNIKTVRAFAAESFEYSKFLQMLRKADSFGSKLGMSKALLEAISRFSIYASLLSLYVYGGFLVNSGVMPLRVLISGIGYTFSLVFATQGITNTFADLAKAATSVRKVSDFIDGLKQPAASTGSKAISGKHSQGEKDVLHENSRHKDGEVLEMHVNSFAYPSRPDVEVLRDIDVSLKPNKVTALVGRSGSGKSTIVQLLCQFYNLDQSSSIKYLGADGESFSRKDWSQIVSLVGQEAVLFPGSVRSNIAYGLDNVSDEQIVAAAKAANAHAFISELPQGYDTDVGERGGQLSGGQRQRIAIARAFIRDTPVLLLDEATSALDAESEKLVQDALEKLFGDKAVLIIAHRLSTVVNADEIIVLDRGQIVERGDHKKLLAKKNGLYQKLVGIQQI